MGKNNCNRCGVKVENKKYNPYNVTFKNYYFGKHERAGEGLFCFKCAEYVVKEKNKCKGGHWNIEKPEEKPQSELCPICGGTGFKTITVLEGNSKFNTLTQTTNKCKCCPKNCNVDDLKRIGENQLECRDFTVKNAIELEANLTRKYS